MFIQDHGVYLILGNLLSAWVVLLSNLFLKGIVVILDTSRQVGLKIQYHHMVK